MMKRTPVLESQGTLQVSKNGPRTRHGVAFFIFGLVNNIVYVIFLSAANDIIKADSSIKKSSVLLASIMPCLLLKIVCPHLVRVVPYAVMVSLCIILSLSSLVLVGVYEAIWIKFAGIVLCSLASGIGETAFLALSSRYHSGVVIAWSSGTGVAGIIGAVYYWTVRSVLQWSLVRTTLTACVWPLLMGLAYTLILGPRHPELTIVPQDSPASSPKINLEAEEERVVSLKDRLKHIRPLFVSYIIPLFLVYYVEYTINTSVYFALLYPLKATPFSSSDDHYRTYSALYQVGVFLSRTFGRRVAPVRNGWWFAILQILMLVILSCEVVFNYIGTIYVIFILILIEGLLGGAAYVNTYCNISENVDRKNLEFSMAVTGIADSSGIGLAALTSLAFEPYLCQRNAVCRILRQ